MHHEMVGITKTIGKKLWRIFTNDAVNPPPPPFTHAISKLLGNAYLIPYRRLTNGGLHTSLQATPTLSLYSREIVARMDRQMNQDK